MTLVEFLKSEKFVTLINKTLNDSPSRIIFEQIILVIEAQQWDAIVRIICEGMLAE